MNENGRNRASERVGLTDSVNVGENELESVVVGTVSSRNLADSSLVRSWGRRDVYIAVREDLIEVVEVLSDFPPPADSFGVDHVERPLWRVPPADLLGQLLHQENLRVDLDEAVLDRLIRDARDLSRFVLFPSAVAAGERARRRMHRRGGGLIDRRTRELVGGRLRGEARQRLTTRRMTLLFALRSSTDLGVHESVLL